MSEPLSKPIVLYDGVCGLCNRLNKFLLKRDRSDRLNFASLQSELAAEVLHRHGADARDLDTVYVVLNHNRPDERIFSRSDAIIYTLTQLNGIWRFAGIGRLLPKFFRDALYRLVANNRYRIFGKHDSCILPEPQYRKKFLEV